MRVVDFLTLVLETHAETLENLRERWGDEELIKILNRSARATLPELSTSNQKLLRSDEPPLGPSAYEMLEARVRSFGLPPLIEDHLWNYPLYRMFIESEVELSASLDRLSSTQIETLILESLDVSKSWVDTLALKPTQRLQADHANRAPWLRFRSKLLKNLGERPLEAV